jgi:hypothetical protein
LYFVVGFSSFTACEESNDKQNDRPDQRLSGPARGKKLTAAASHENFSRTLNGYDFCTNQLILYDLSAILPC